LISTSIYEGFPNVIAEAISYNCIIITSNSFGGVTDLIKNESFGYIYDLYDSKQLSIKMKKSMKKTKNNYNKKIKARKNLNLIYLKNKRLINFLLKI
jgi:UDP-D-galactose:(glucosyl)LPS alpha-1,6-D-galactosyltransferase